jgi:hypothetical protein
MLWGNVIETHEHAGVFKEPEAIMVGISSKQKAATPIKHDG